MSVKQEASGRRYVEVVVDVLGRPEEVWQAIATGPGISSWFVPAEIEQQDGKPVAVKLNFGPGMEVRSAITTWEPPRKWASLSDGWAPGSPPMANEWSIEDCREGACKVRVAHSLVADSDQWDDQLKGVEAGWPAFLATLRLYLAHFRGQQLAAMKWMIPVAGPEAEAWERLTAALSVKGLQVGQHWSAPPDVPSVRGVVEYVGQNPYDILLRIDKPSPGIAALGAVDCGGQSMVALNFYLYGDQAEGAIASEKPLWDAWFQDHFPMPATPDESVPAGG